MQRMKLARQSALAGALAVAAVVLVAAPAHAEYRSYPGVNCEGYGYTTARTAAQWDQSSIGKYSSSAYDYQQWGPNYSGTVQVHNNFTSYHRTSVAVIQTTTQAEYYVSASHACDN